VFSAIPTVKRKRKRKINIENEMRRLIFKDSFLFDIMRAKNREKRAKKGNKNTKLKRRKSI